jgi:hypothetical protein
LGELRRRGLWKRMVHPQPPARPGNAVPLRGWLEKAPLFCPFKLEKLSRMIITLFCSRIAYNISPTFPEKIRAVHTYRTTRANSSLYTYNDFLAGYSRGNHVNSCSCSGFSLYGYDPVGLATSKFSWGIPTIVGSYKDWYLSSVHFTYGIMQCTTKQVYEFLFSHHAYSFCQNLFDVFTVVI